MSGEENGSDGEGFSELADWFLETDYWLVALFREVVAHVAIIAVLAMLLFAISGVWPPFVAVKSNSMQPHLSQGDLVFMIDEQRLSPAFSAADTGVVTYRTGEKQGYKQFGAYGDVIAFQPQKPGQSRVIHRAHFWVNESENWYAKANKSYLAGSSCAEVPNCPAPHSGFVTKGDGNKLYDQANGVSGPVKPSWIQGTAEIRIPYLGYARVLLERLSTAVLFQVGGVGVDARSSQIPYQSPEPI